jgi:alpha-tubulin suppressor-like RCC1 family protein
MQFSSSSSRFTHRRAGARWLALLAVAASLMAGAATAQIIFRPIKFPPPPPDELIALTSGANHNCVARRDGMVLCWGRNSSGELGIGTNRSDWCGSFFCALLPTRVVTDINGAAFSSTRVTAGWDHSCALDNTGATLCWGANGNSQTGVPALAQVWQPAPTAGGKRFTAISAGNQTTCAVEPTATWCWGLLNTGAPGTPTLNGDQTMAVVRRTLTPTAILPSSAGFQAVSVGSMHACMQTNISGFNDVNCIGRNDFGELGYPTSFGPAFVIFGSTFGRPVGPPSSRATFTCVDRLSNGTVACAGQNVYGMLGNGNNTNSGDAVVVGGGAALAGVAAGWTHACAIDPQQRAWCWGYNGWGQLGNGNTVSSNTPVLVGGGTVKFRALSAGYQHTCGIGTDNKVYCWGNNDAGQLGRGYSASYDWLPRTAAGPFRM